jgi:hypothetical protein
MSDFSKYRSLLKQIVQNDDLGQPYQSAPFYEHNEDKIKALQMEGIRLDDIVIRQRVHIRTLETQNEQLAFLLSQAPIRLAPANLMEAARSVTKYAYLSRRTFLNNIASNVFAVDGRAQRYYTIAPSPTKWVMTDLMPYGTVIYTPNEMPGMTNITLNLQDPMHGE